jgi:hypothetical protein
MFERGMGRGNLLRVCVAQQQLFFHIVKQCSSSAPTWLRQGAGSHVPTTYQLSLLFDGWHTWLCKRLYLCAVSPLDPKGLWYQWSPSCRYRNRLISWWLLAKIVHCRFDQQYICIHPHVVQFWKGLSFIPCSHTVRPAEISFHYMFPFRRGTLADRQFVPRKSCVLDLWAKWVKERWSSSPVGNMWNVSLTLASYFKF